MPSIFRSALVALCAQAMLLGCSTAARAQDAAPATPVPSDLTTGVYEPAPAGLPDSTPADALLDDYPFDDYPFDGYPSDDYLDGYPDATDPGGTPPSPSVARLNVVGRPTLKRVIATGLPIQVSCRRRCSFGIAAAARDRRHRLRSLSPRLTAMELFQRGRITLLIPVRPRSVRRAATKHGLLVVVAGPGAKPLRIRLR